MALTVSQIAEACGARPDRAERCAEVINKAMELYYIDLTPQRMAMFLANYGHETGGLHYFTELWGPTDVQKRYEGRLDLGNTEPGDGSKFRGHGGFQTTGRKNHAAARDRLRAKFPDMDIPDFEEEPERLADPEWAAISAADFVEMNGLNQYADREDIDGYCDMVNRGHKTKALGDSNGWVERLRLYTAGLAVIDA